VTQISDAPRIRNGVNVDTMFGTLDAIKANPTLAKFQWRASNSGWAAATTAPRSKSSMGPVATIRPGHGWDIAAGEPAILLGKDEGPNPAEFLPRAGRLPDDIAGIRGRGLKVELDSVESTIEGDMDVQGALGLDDEVRNGFQGIRVSLQ
jgi:hypothetical protein